MAPGSMALAQWPLFSFQEFWEIDKISHFSISKSKGVYQNFPSSETSSSLDQIPDLKSERTFNKPPPLPPHENFDFDLTG